MTSLSPLVQERKREDEKRKAQEVLKKTRRKTDEAVIPGELMVRRGSQPRLLEALPTTNPTPVPVDRQLSDGQVTNLISRAGVKRTPSLRATSEGSDRPVSPASPVERELSPQTVSPVRAAPTSSPNVASFPDSEPAQRHPRDLPVSAPTKLVPSGSPDADAYVLPTSPGSPEEIVGK